MLEPTRTTNEYVRKIGEGSLVIRIKQYSDSDMIDLYMTASSGPLKLNIDDFSTLATFLDQVAYSIREKNMHINEEVGTRPE